MLVQSAPSAWSAAPNASSVSTPDRSAVVSTKRTSEVESRRSSPRRYAPYIAPPATPAVSHAAGRTLSFSSTEARRPAPTPKSVDVVTRATSGRGVSGRELRSLPVRPKPANHGVPRALGRLAERREARGRVRLDARRAARKRFSNEELVNVPQEVPRGLLGVWTGEVPVEESDALLSFAHCHMASTLRV